MLTTALTLFLLLGLAATAPAGPLDTPGYAKAVTCSACHGANGNSRSESMPILAGMNVAYFKKAIEDYAAGRRPSPEMEPFAKQVQLLGVDEIAAFFAAQKREPVARQAGSGGHRARAAPPPPRARRATARKARGMPPSSCPPSPASRPATSAISSCCSRRTSAARAIRR